MLALSLKLTQKAGSKDSEMALPFCYPTFDSYIFEHLTSPKFL
jgi:hypothetical protein